MDEIRLNLWIKVHRAVYMLHNMLNYIINIGLILYARIVIRYLLIWYFEKLKKMGDFQRLSNGRNVTQLVDKSEPRGLCVT